MACIMDPRISKRAKNAKCVLKELGHNVQDLSPNLQSSFYQEIAMLHMLRDEPFFARFCGYSSQPATMLLRFYPLGSLMGYIAGESKKAAKHVYSKRQVVSLLKQLASGFGNMHRLKYAH